MRLRLHLPLALALLGLAPACAGETEDDTNAPESSSAAATRVAAYDAVIRSGTSIQNETRPNATQSASTRVLGFVPRLTPAKVLDRLLTVAKWSEITDADGQRPFTRSELLDENGSGATRKVAARLTLEAGVEIDARAAAKEADDGVLTVRIVNSTAYSHWLVGTVLKPEKMSIDFKLVPYQGGTVVDATMKVKLEAVEDRAPGVTQTLGPMFEWLKKTAR